MFIRSDENYNEFSYSSSCSRNNTDLDHYFSTGADLDMHAYTCILSNSFVECGVVDILIICYKYDIKSF